MITIIAGFCEGGDLATINVIIIVSDETISCAPIYAPALNRASPGWYKNLAPAILVSSEHTQLGSIL